MGRTVCRQATPLIGFQCTHICVSFSRTHDVLTKWLVDHGWDVTPHYLVETGWVARYSRGKGGRTLGVNSEMDALPGIGHACGHNLIAIAGVAVACAVRAVLEEFSISGSVVLLGTPGMRRKVPLHPTH